MRDLRLIVVPTIRLHMCTFCSPDIATAAEWYIEKTPFSSDHFPITISLFLNHRNNIDYFKPKYNIGKANWTKYILNSRKYSSERPVSSNIIRETENICRIINQTANDSIPNTSIKLNKISPLV